MSQHDLGKPVCNSGFSISVWLQFGCDKRKGDFVLNVVNVVDFKIIRGVGGIKRGGGGRDGGGSLMGLLLHYCHCVADVAVAVALLILLHIPGGDHKRPAGMANFCQIRSGRL